MMVTDDDYPIVSTQDGIKLKTEKMTAEVLYHCIYEDKVFLFYKDEESLLHCYEVEYPDAVKEIIANPSEIERVLEKYAKKLNKKDLE